MELASSMLADATHNASTTLQHGAYVVFRASPATRAQRAHPLGKLRFHSLLEVEARGDDGALTPQWNQQWMTSEKALFTLVMNKDETTGIRFVLIDWAGSSAPSETVTAQREISSSLDRALRKVIPLEIMISTGDAEVEEITWEAVEQVIQQKKQAATAAAVSESGVELAQTQEETSNVDDPSTADSESPAQS